MSITILLLFIPSSEAFSSRKITAGTCPKISIKGWGYARQQQQQGNQNRRYSSPASSPSTRRYSIFYDDFEDFTTNTNINKEGNEDVVVGNNNSSDEDDMLFASSLKARQDVLHTEKQQRHKQQKEQNEEENMEKERLKHNWREANCVSTVRLSLEDDWIRRIAIDLYPIVVCGTSRGNLYLGDLDSGDEIDCLESVHASTGDVAELLTFNKNEKSDSNSDTAVPLGLSNCLQALYDGHDGNGPFAIAVKNDLIVSSGREGGIHACTIVGKEVDIPNSSSSSSSNSNGRSSGRGLNTATKQTKLKLQREGKFRGLEEAAIITVDDKTKGESDTNDKKNRAQSQSQQPPPLITSLKFDDRGTLWAGGYDGTLRGYHHKELDVDDRPLMLRQKHPDYEIDVGSPIIDMSIQEETGVIVVTTETEGVFVYSLDMDVRSGDGRDKRRTCLLHVNPFAGRGSYLTKEGNQGQKQFCRTAMIVRNNDNHNNNNSTDITNKSNTNIINDITDKEIGKTTHTLIVGGSFGHMYQFTIRLYGDTTRTTCATSTTTTASEDDDSPPSRPIAVSSVSAESMQKFRPKHMGPIVSLASPSPGLFVTASQDGTMRVWDCSNNDDDNDTNDIHTRVEKALDVVVEEEDDEDADGVEEEKDEGKEGDFRSRLRAARKQQRKKKNNNPKVLYALSGYKVWLGSIFANGSKLVSDGADNSIIVHSFDSNEEEILRSQQDDEEDGEKGEEDPFGAFS